MKDFNRALEISPGDRDVLYELANIFLIIGDTEKPSKFIIKLLIIIRMIIYI